MHFCNLKTLIKEGFVMSNGSARDVGWVVRGRGSPKGRSEWPDGCAEYRSPRRPVDGPRDGKTLRYTRIECNKSGGESERKILQVHIALRCATPPFDAPVYEPTHESVGKDIRLTRNALTIHVEYFNRRISYYSFQKFLKYKRFSASSYAYEKKTSKFSCLHPFKGNFQLFKHILSIREYVPLSLRVKYCVQVIVPHRHQCLRH